VTGPTSAGASSERSTEAEVLATAAALVAAFGSHDVAAYFDAFADDATFVFHTAAARLDSRAEYEALWHRWEHEDGFHVISCTSSGQRVQLLGDVAVFTHDVTTVVDAAGERATTDERETIVFARLGDRWLAVHEHLSPAPAAS
jgi:ketosteroid isomerase-like protein